MSDWISRVLIVSFWAVCTAALIWVFSRMGMLLPGLVGLGLLSYVFVGVGMWAIVYNPHAQRLKWYQGWRMVLAWMPGLLSDKVRVWVMWETSRSSPYSGF